MSKLTVNQLVDLEYFREGWEGTYKTRVEDVQDDTVVLGIPFLERGGLLPVKEGESVSIRYWDQVACYAATTIITQVLLHPLPLVKIAMPNHISRLQRRSFVRVESSLPLKFTQLDTENTVSTKTIDLSAGGVRFYHTQSIDAGTILELSITLDTFVLECKGEVIRVIWEERGKFQLCVRFINLNEKQTDTLVAWVFKRQLELRKRGVL